MYFVKQRKLPPSALNLLKAKAPSRRAEKLAQMGVNAFVPRYRSPKHGPLVWLEWAVQYCYTELRRPA